MVGGRYPNCENLAIWVKLAIGAHTYGTFHSPTARMTQPMAQRALLDSAKAFSSNEEMHTACKCLAAATAGPFSPPDRAGAGVWDLDSGQMMVGGTQIKSLLG